MPNVKERYQELMLDLQLTRAEAGGTLSQEAEAGFIGPLDTLWWQMSSEEHQEVEKWLRSSVSAPESLNLIDVAPGSKHFPRVSV